jgi:hypothetical protein
MMMVNNMTAYAVAGDGKRLAMITIYPIIAWWSGNAKVGF